MDIVGTLFMEESDAAIRRYWWWEKRMEEKTHAQINIEKFELANKWIYLLNRKKSILQNLRDKGIIKIIIYGASEFGVRLLEQCENENNIVEVIGIVDKKISSKGAYYKNIPLMSINDIVNLNMNDTSVVITAMGFCEEIMDMLKSEGIINIISLKEMIEDTFC